MEYEGSPTSQIGCWERKGKDGKNGEVLFTARVSLVALLSGSLWNFLAPRAVGKAPATNSDILP